MNEWIITAGVLLLLTVTGAGLYYLERRQRRNALLRWATNQGFRVIDYRQPFLTESSPFPFIASKAQQVFHFTVQRADGIQKSGWVLLGSPWGGLNSDDAAIQWDA